MQVEDPRQQWQKEQEEMLKDYLMVSQHNLQVCQFLLLFEFIFFLLHTCSSIFVRFVYIFDVIRLAAFVLFSLILYSFCL